MEMGYVGKSRSIRSQIAIDNAEVPLSHITKDYILTFVSENNIDEELKITKNKQMNLNELLSILTIQNSIT